MSRLSVRAEKARENRELGTHTTLSVAELIASRTSRELVVSEISGIWSALGRPDELDLHIVDSLSRLRSRRRSELHVWPVSANWQPGPLRMDPRALRAGYHAKSRSTLLYRKQSENG